MEFEFDKEMDSLLRQTAKGGNVFAAENPSGEHIDADEISMFAESALPEKTKPRVMKHLADCNRCRTILSNVIVLNAEAETEVSAIPVQETKAETVVASTEPNWFQKLYSTKNLAFGMGALALVFVVGIGFLVVQNMSGLQSADLAQANTNSAAADKTTASENAPTVDQSAENSNSTSLGEDSTVGDSTIGDSTANSTANTATDSGGDLSARRESQSESKENVADDGLAKPKPDAPGRADLKRESPQDKTSINEGANESNIVGKNKDEGEKVRTESDDTSSADQASPPPPASKSSSPITTRSSGTTRAKKSKDRDAESAEERKSSDNKSGKRSISSKTFTRKGRVWYDSAYKNQRTTNVRRNTKQYQKLDSGLRSIGNQLDGTVVVVWKSKAYRID